MAGHSKWANIKHRKDRADKKKGKLFSRAIKEIISAVKQGGPDSKANGKLKLAIQKAREANVPLDTIERNIKKAAGSDQGDFFAITYELYGYGGVGIIVDALTDNKNRTASDLRIAVNKCGGTIASVGSVAFNFDRKGVITVALNKADEEQLFLLVTECGAEDFVKEDDCYEITTSIEKFIEVQARIKESGIEPDEAGLEMVPKVFTDCSEEDMQANAKLIEWLENLDDVDSVYCNMR